MGCFIPIPFVTWGPPGTFKMNAQNFCSESIQESTSPHFFADGVEDSEGVLELSIPGKGITKIILSILQPAVFYIC